MKKIIVGMFVFAIMFVSHTAVASSVWNSSSKDCRGLSVANHTTNTGIVVPCWPLSSVYAGAENSVNVRIYYHNTSGQPATGVKVLLNAPTGSGNSHTISGQITSDQGNLSLGSVTVGTPTGSKLVFGGSHWLPNQRQSESSLLYGQNGSEVLGDGLRIGTIESSWEAQGSVVVTFYVQKLKPTGSITSSKSACLISVNQSSCEIPFSWNTNNPIDTSVIKKDGMSGVYKTGNNGSNISFSIPFGSSTFSLYNNNIELDTESVSASCISGSNWDSSTGSCRLPLNDCKINSFSANQNEVTQGEGVRLTWNTNYCKSVSISGVGSNLLPNSSSTVWPTSTTTYILTGFGDTSVSPSSSVKVVVGGPVGAPGYPAGAPSYGA